jgi:hypothetical protein
MTNLSTETLEVLKNFASINPNLVVKAGEPLTTIAEAKNVFAKATIPEPFESDFGIYDLNEFINVVNLVGDPTLEFNDECAVIKNGSSKASYRFADPAILTAPTSQIKMPDAEVSVTVTEDQLTQVRKAAAVLGHSVVSVTGNEGTISLSVTDAKNSSANTFDMVIDEDNDCTAEFDFQFLIANIRVVGGDYKVDISSKFISRWENTVAPIEYYIALEKSSTFTA